MPAVKFGLMIPSPTQPIDEVFKHSRLAEKNGFDSIWIADHLVMMRPGFVPDAWSVLSAISMITKNMMLGTCVSDPHRKHPAVFAQILATIDSISNGRVALGMGPGESMNVKAFGIDFERPVAKMTESVEIIRRLLNEKKVTYDGDFFELKDAFLQVKPVGKVPFYIGSNSPKTRRLTGRIGDGWMPFLETPDTYRDHLKDVHVGTEEANRDLTEIDTSLLLSTAISGDKKEAFDCVNPYRVNYATMPDKVRAAYPNRKFPEVSHDLLSSSSPASLAGLARFAASIPKDAVYDFNVVGTLEDCMKQIERYIRSGVNHFILVNRGPDHEKILETYGKKIIPYFKQEF